MQSGDAELRGLKSESIILNDDVYIYPLPIFNGSLIIAL